MFFILSFLFFFDVAMADSSNDVYKKSKPQGVKGVDKNLIFDAPKKFNYDHWFVCHPTIVKNKKDVVYGGYLDCFDAGIENDPRHRYLENIAAMIPNISTDYFFEKAKTDKLVHLKGYDFISCVNGISPPCLFELPKPLSSCGYKVRILGYKGNDIPTSRNDSSCLDQQDLVATDIENNGVNLKYNNMVWIKTQCKATKHQNAECLIKGLEKHNKLPKKVIDQLSSFDDVSLVAKDIENIKQCISTIRKNKKENISSFCKKFIPKEYSKIIDKDNRIPVTKIEVAKMYKEYMDAVESCVVNKKSLENVKYIDSSCDLHIPAELWERLKEAKESERIGGTIW